MDGINNFKLEEICSGIPGGFFIYHATGDEELVYANQEVLRMYNCADMDEFREYVGNSFRGMVHPEDLEQVEQSIIEQIGSNHRKFDYVEYRIIPKGGSVRWIEDFGHLVNSDTYGEVFYVFITDITERVWQDLQRKQALRDIRDKQELLHRTFEHAAFAHMEVYVLDLRDDTFQMLYPYLQWQGESKDYREFLALKIKSGSIYDPDGRLSLLLQPQNIREALLEQDSVEYRYQRVWGDHPREWCSVTLSVGERAEEEPLTVVMNIRSIERDVEQEKQQKSLLESALLRVTQADAAKTSFLSNISHDIRTPMNAIIGFAELGLHQNANPAKMRDCLTKIKESSDVLLGLIDNILDMSRIESGELHIMKEPNNLLDVLEQCRQGFEPLLLKKRLRYTCDTSQVQNVYVCCDAFRLKRLLDSLIGNAVKFTRPGGRISVTVRQTPSLSHEVGNYEFVIRDNGIGISPEFLPKIFLPFEREQTSTVSRTSGTGLGLSLTKSIVDLMNGTIQVDSKPGNGTAFTVLLPFRIANPTDDTPKKEPAGNDYSRLIGKHVLLVEDNELNREIAKELLAEYGLIVDEAENGDAALKMLKRFGSKYSVVLMDLQMPKLDGYQAARAIRQLPNDELSHVPIIALSANAFEEDKRQVLECGMNEHLPKPLDVVQVMDTIKRLI